MTKRSPGLLPLVLLLGLAPTAVRAESVMVAAASSVVSTASTRPTSSALTAMEILRRMDDNMTFGTRKSRTVMEIHDGSDVRRKEMVSWGEGVDTAFVRFEEPARDRGTKYLKRGGRLWVYLPSAEKVIRISGHMLRRSMMGSDFSYEDFLDAPVLTRDYRAEIVGTEAVEGHLCWILDLRATVRRVTYPRRKIWIDQRGFAPRRSELFARGDRLVKRMRFGEDRLIGNRIYPTRYHLENLLRQGTHTIMYLKELEFDGNLPPGIFSQAQLRKGN